MGHVAGQADAARAVGSKWWAARFNAMLQTIPGGPGLSHVQYVDLRNTLTSDIQGYKKSWGDELHPTKPGFLAVAAKIAGILKALPQAPTMNLESAGGRTPVRSTARRRRGTRTK